MLVSSTPFVELQCFYLIMMMMMMMMIMTTTTLKTFNIDQNALENDSIVTKFQ